MLQAELKILAGKHQGKTIPLTSKKFLVGREQDCHLRPGSELVSRHHCVFSIDDYAVRLRDLGSTNGTFVNGQAIRGEVVLKPGDQISIGRLDLELTVKAGVQVTAPAFVDQPAEAAPLPEASATMEFPAEAAVSQEGQDTTFDLPTFVQNPGAPVSPADYGPDTAIINAQQAAQYGQPAPGMYYPQPGQPYPGYPQGMPPGYPPQGGYPQPGQYMPYPPQPGQYPQGGQYPMGQFPPGQYPPNMYPGGYPQYPMGYGQPQPQQPQEPVPEAKSGSKVIPNMEIRLPDPGATGAVDVPKPVPAPAASGAGQATEGKPSTTAADIIKQYMQRRS